MALIPETPETYQAKQQIVRRLQRAPLDADEIDVICERGAWTIARLQPQQELFTFEPHDVATVKGSTQPAGFVVVGRVWSGDRSWLVTWNLETGAGGVTLERLENGYGWSATF